MGSGPGKSCRLRCLSCSTILAHRACRSVLLSDRCVELYSTSHPARNARQVGRDYMAYACGCTIRDTSCGGCRVIVGYHIVQPCEQCLEARSSGDLWVFDIGTVTSKEHGEAMCSSLNIFEPDSDYEVKIR
jgi:hypothetical protein